MKTRAFTSLLSAGTIPLAALGLFAASAPSAAPALAGGDHAGHASQQADAVRSPADSAKVGALALRNRPRHGSLPLQKRLIAQKTSQEGVTDDTMIGSSHPFTIAKPHYCVLRSAGQTQDCFRKHRRRATVLEEKAPAV